MPDGHYLFFTPEAGVVPHMSMQILLARILKEKGHKVLFVRCHGIYPHCPVMDMYILPHDSTRENQAKCCGPCLQASQSLLDAYGMESIDLRDFLTVDMVGKINTLLEEPPKDLRDFRYDDIPFGTMTVIDLVLATKVSDFAGLSEAMRAIWLKYITNALLSYLMTREIMARIPIKGIIHHEDYGLLLAARLAGAKEGIPAIHVGFTGQMGGDRRRVFLMHKAGSGDDQKTMVKWPEWRELCLPPDKVPDPMDDMLGRFGSISARVYSPKKTIEGKDLYAELGIPRDRKLLVAYTSSLDERLAVDSVVDALGQRLVHVTQPWPSQIAWLGDVCEWVGKREDYHLVVRVHPREGANKRENKISQHLVQLKAAFDRPIRNATFVWPGMDVSSYDLAEIADLVLTAWTTLGLEVARAGVPVLASTWSLAPRPNDDFQAWAPTPEAWFAKLEELVGRAPDLGTVLHAFRWHMAQNLGHTVDFGDIIPTRDFHGLPVFFMPAAAGDVEDVLVHRKDLLDINRDRLRAAQGPGSAAAERAAVRVQMRRALRFLFTGEEQGADYRLIAVRAKEAPGDFLAGLGASGIPDGTALILIDGKRAHLAMGGRILSRDSAMAARLAVLGCDQALGLGIPLPEEAAVLPDKAALKALLGAGEPANAEEAVALANRLKDEGRNEDAFAAANRAVSRGLRSAELLNLQGHLACLCGRPDTGKAIFLGVVESWPGFAKAHNNLSVLQWNGGERREALLSLAAGLKADPDNRDLVGNGVRMFKALGEKEQAKALGAYYVKRHPADEPYMTALVESAA